MNKPTLLLFADYCCNFALWNDGNHDILDGSDKQLLSLGVSKRTLRVLKVIVDVHDSESAFTEPTPELVVTYNYLTNLAKRMLEQEIGDKFTIIIKD